MTKFRRGVTVVIAGVALLWTGTGAALDPADKCVAAKIKTAGKYNLCRMKAESKAVRKGEPPDFTRCDTKFDDKWAKIETRAAGACPVTGDVAGIRDIVVADTGLIAGTVAARIRFQDNGDGTIADVHTGLIWEKKSLDDSIHSMTQGYTWDAAFTVHVAGLNTASFAGHADWRVPTINELYTLVNYDAHEPPAYPAFDTNCDGWGCTVETCSCAFAESWGRDWLWSSTTNVDDEFPNSAWVLDTWWGWGVPDNGKIYEQLVMAVRGGRRGL